jgi:nicotinate-nucleotide adenylyltransferase
MGRKCLGILGGTFDPPHIAHLVLADQARAQLGLQQVLFCPVGQQPLKPGQPVTPILHRLAMTELAITSHPYFALSHVDVDRPGPHYTADALGILQADYAGYELYFLMGADSFNNILKWRDPDRIIAQARLAVAPRPGIELNLSELDKALPGLKERTVWIDSPWLDISATDIRRRVQSGLPIHYLVSHQVENYIEQNGLYR